MVDHLKKVLDFIGEFCPPLLLNCPFTAISSLSCCIFNYLQTLKYFCLNLSSSLFRSFANSSNPVLIFFCKTCSSCSCFWTCLFRAVSILMFLLFIHAMVSSCSSWLHLTWTLWASAKLNKFNLTFSVSTCVLPFFGGWEVQRIPWFWWAVELISFPWSLWVLLHVFVSFRIPFSDHLGRNPPFFYPRTCWNCQVRRGEFYRFQRLPVFVWGWIRIVFWFSNLSLIVQWRFCSFRLQHSYHFVEIRSFHQPFFRVELRFPQKACLSSFSGSWLILLWYLNKFISI